MPNGYSPIARLQKNKAIWDEIREKVATGAIAADTDHPVTEAALEGLFPSAPHGRRGGTESLADRPRMAGTSRRSQAHTEAIIVRVGQPPMLVQGGTYVLPDQLLPSVRKLIEGFPRDKINPAISRTGRIELLNYPAMPFVGTGWILEKRGATTAVIATNRHVAEFFASYDGRGGYEFLTRPNGKEFVAQIDFHEEYQQPSATEIPVVRVLYIAGSREPDMALLEITDERLKDYEPMEPSETAAVPEMPVGIIGYPAFDSRNDVNDVARYFGDIFNVKRFAFGSVIGVSADSPEFYHDATTLGGNSGSAVINRDSGKVLGLHFGGSYLEMNYAVPIAEVLRAKAGLTSAVVVTRQDSEAPGDGQLPIAHYKKRDGYNPAFLGAGFSVPLPLAGDKWKNDLVDTIDADKRNATTPVLRYRHFSVMMCASRKLPLITAVNIDGNKAKKVGRIDKWYIDPRFGKEFQVDNAAYTKNALDRGHMVRREDPVWGTAEIAAQANQDTFHYANAAPQHEDLNQRDWVRLEDYVLGNAKTRGLKVSVFTGPIFKDGDPPYRDGLVRLPRAFWKIAVVVNDETDKLSATGYILCQGELIKDLTAEFAYGAFMTYQVPVSLIEKESGLDLSALTPHDPFNARRKREGIENSTRDLFSPITRGSDIVM